VVSKTKRRFSVSIDDESYNQLLEIATQNSVSISWVIRYALVNFLNERDEGRNGQLVIPFPESS
jgi:predicted transcriptional regulator